MPHKQPTLERQLTTAQQQLDACEADLGQRGLSEKDKSRDAVWRQLNARRLKLKSRLRSAAAVVELTEEAKRLKAEKPPKSKEQGGKKAAKKGEKKQKQTDAKQKKEGKK